MRSKLVFSICLAFLLVSTVPAFSRVVSVFGPAEFVKTQGQPKTYTRTFSVDSGVTDCKLWVQNGADGTKAVKNVSVSVNGQEIFSSKDLKLTNTSEKQILLQQNNTLTVSLKGQEGNFITVEILGQIADTPLPPSTNEPPMPGM